MKKYIKAISLFSVSILLFSCNTTKTKKVEKTSEITEKYWKLIEINGQKVTAENATAKEPHLILKSEENRVNGNGGCNSFFGTYELQTNTNRISFSKISHAASNTTANSSCELRVSRRNTRTIR